MADSFHKDIDEEVEEAPQYGNEKESLLDPDNEGLINHDEPLDPQYYKDKRDEEMAAELAADPSSLGNEPMESEEKETDMQDGVQAGWGWFAVILAALSFFIMPVIMGAAGIILGFVARRRGANTLGNVAIIVGAISVILALFLAPF